MRECRLLAARSRKACPLEGGDWRRAMSLKSAIAAARSLLFKSPPMIICDSRNSDFILRTASVTVSRQSEDYLAVYFGGR